MTNLSTSINPRAHWWLRTLAFLLAGFPLAAQQTTLPSPLTAEQVVRRVMAMNQQRANSLQYYSSVRSYHLECHCLSRKEADMVVRADYHSPNTKEFTILSESGSGTVRHRVFQRLLEAEIESMQQENQERTAITPENYTFRVLDYQKTDVDEVYVLDVQPQSKNKFLFRGRIWVDARDFAVTRAQGEPAVNPSYWTQKTDFTRTYRKVGDFWLPESNESTTKVRIFGTAVLTIGYRDYQITQAPDSRITSSQEKLSNGQ